MAMVRARVSIIFLSSDRLDGITSSYFPLSYQTFRPVILGPDGIVGYFGGYSYGWKEDGGIKEGYGYSLRRIRCRICRIAIFFRA
jgi:hypothetical protein